MINLSIIIPHKNIPQLLLRCISSIPVKDDIEIIIIDDNSDNLDKTNFPGINRLNTHVIFSPISLTAGGARNKGLSIATGKFVMFADADDFFHNGFYENIQSYFSQDYDLVYFGMDSVDSESLLPARRGEGIVPILNSAKRGNIECQSIIKYKYLYPSCKLIKKELINRYDIKFDEVPASNDTMFGVKVAATAERIFFDDKIIYCLTYRTNSLVTSFNYDNLKSRFIVSFDLFNYLHSIKKEKYAQSILSHWWKLRKVSYWKLVENIPTLIRNYKIRALVLDVKSAIRSRIIRN